MAYIPLNNLNGRYFYTDPVSGMQIPATGLMYPPATASNLGVSQPRMGGVPATIQQNPSNSRSGLNGWFGKNFSNNSGDRTSQSMAGAFTKKGRDTLTPLQGVQQSVGVDGNAFKPAAQAAGGGGLGSWFGNNFGWDKKSGLTMFGKNLGKTANIGSGIMYGLDAIGGLGDLSSTQSQTDDLLTDILRSSASNPLLNSYLTSDQMSMLNKIKRGNYRTEASATDFDLAGLLSSAGQGALTGGITGGIPGAIIGALGGGITSNIDRQNQDQQRINAELEGLLQALTDAESQYNMMKRPNFTGLGIQSRYQNMYM
jgi:hypothetical protein